MAGDVPRDLSRRHVGYLAGLCTVSKTRDDLLWWLLHHFSFDLEVPFKGLSGKRRFRWDAAREDLMIAVEYQGQGIGHNIAPNQATDHEKLSEGALCGWLVIVTDAASVNNGKAFEYIEQAIDVRAEEASRAWKETQADAS